MGIHASTGPDADLKGEGVAVIETGTSTFRIWPGNPVSDSVVLGFTNESLKKWISGHRDWLDPEFASLISVPYKAGLLTRTILPAALRDRVIPELQVIGTGGRSNPFLIESCILEVLGQCLGVQEESASGAGEADDRSALTLLRIETMKSFLQDHLDEPLSLAKLSALLGCGGHYLSRLFTTHEHLSLTHYLRRIRIERAAQLLEKGRLNVSEAALEVGYQSLSHFTKAFSAEKGTTPSAYRRSRAHGGGVRESANLPSPGASTMEKGT
jgi:AraC-like DNA-binding protein